MSVASAGRWELEDAESEYGEKGSMVSVDISWPEKKSARRIRRWPARDLGSILS